MIIKINWATACALLYFAGLSTFSSNAAAQETNANDEVSIEEVIVTATRRSTSLAVTPLAVSALTAEMLQRANVSSMSDLAAEVTGLNIVNQGGGLTRPVIRGLQGVGDAQVGVYLDNTPITGSPGTANSAGRFGPEMEPVDMERVEVLRGPQGTLYGGSAMGGAIRYVTNKPDLSRFSGRFEAGVSSYESSMGYDGNVVLNVPLAQDKLALRFVGYQRDEDGYIDNVVTGATDVNDMETRGGRLALGWTPSDAVEILATYYYEDFNAGARAIVHTDLPDLQTRNPGPDGIDDETSIFNISATFETSWSDITYSFSKYERDLLYRYTIALDPFGAAPPNFGGTLLTQPQDVDTNIHELRFVSNQDSQWNWTVGAFYSERDAFGESDLYYLDTSGLLIFPDGSPGAMEDDISSLLFRRNVDQTQTEKAIYGEVSYDFTDRTTLTFGTRVFSFDNRDGGQPIALFGGPFPGNPPFVEASTDHDGEVFKLHLSHSILDDSVIYASWTQGYRAGGVNVELITSGFDPLDTPLTFAPDKVDNFEIGFRGALRDGRMTVAAAAFYLDWTDMFVNQERTDLPGLGNIEFRANAGEAEITGLEFEIEALVGEDLKLSAGTTILSGELSSDVQTYGDSTGALKGDNLPFVPDLTLNLTAEYGWEIRNMRAYVWGGYRYTGETTGDFNPFVIDQGGQTTTPNISYTEFGDYGILNLRLGLEADTWTGALLINNATDERECAYLRRDFIRPPPGNCFIEKPRSIGLRFTKEF